eukprot:3144505-Rhodomonas_salina.1
MATSKRRTFLLLPGTTSQIFYDMPLIDLGQPLEFQAWTLFPEAAGSNRVGLRQVMRLFVRLKLRVRYSRFEIRGSGFRVSGFGLRVEGPVFSVMWVEASGLAVRMRLVRALTRSLCSQNDLLRGCAALQLHPAQQQRHHIGQKRDPYGAQNRRLPVQVAGVSATDLVAQADRSGSSGWTWCCHMRQRLCLLLQRRVLLPNLRWFRRASGVEMWHTISAALLNAVKQLVPVL